MVNGLEHLRAEIDRIDDRLLELLRQRIRLAGEIARHKGGADSGPVVRPAREARILRRLVKAAGGEFPADALVRIWRELFAATGRAQRPYAVAVHARRCEEWEAVRDHLGSAVPILRADSCGHALRLVRDGRAELAVVPLDEATAGWWWAFAQGGGHGVRAAARLPFLITTPGLVPLLLLGALPPEPSGADRSLVALLVDHGLSRARLAELLAQAGAPPELPASLTCAEGTVHFAEIEGFHSSDGATLAQLLAPVQRHILRLELLGAYPRPMVATEATASAEPEP